MARDSGDGMASVDKALQILVLLGERERVRVMEVADYLGVARSTAHRLLVALMSRQFVVQDANKVYHRGPAFLGAGFGREGLCFLRVSMRPFLEDLAKHVDETCHLVMLEGNGARFLDGVKSSQNLRVGLRTGTLLPAHITAAGKALLAELSPADFFSLYPFGLPGQKDLHKRAELQQELTQVRKRGYATNFNESERGVTAVAVALKNPGGRAVASFAVAGPSARWPRSRLEPLVTALRETADAAEKTLAAPSADSVMQNPDVASL
ncbi:IclR family transcriptional regulator [Streptomyces sp. NPDC054919]